MDLNNFKTNIEHAEEGVWCPVDTETQVKIARYGNKKFQRCLQKLMAPYKRLIDQGKLDNETADKIMVEAIAEGVLIDWKGLTKDGQDFKYSKSRAIEILSDPSLSDFREFVVSLAQDVELFRSEQVEQAVEK